MDKLWLEVAGKSSAASWSSFNAALEKGQVREKLAERSFSHSLGACGFSSPYTSKFISTAGEPACTTQLPQPMHKPARLISAGPNKSVLYIGKIFTPYNLQKISYCHAGE